MLESTIPCYKVALVNTVCYEITFNNYEQFIKSPPTMPSASSAARSSDAKCNISNIFLEYDILKQPTLRRRIASEFQDMAILYNLMLRHRRIKLNKSDTTWSRSFNTPCKSLKTIFFCLQIKSHTNAMQVSCKIWKYKKVSVIEEAKPNQVIAQEMKSFEDYQEIR